MYYTWVNALRLKKNPFRLKKDTYSSKQVYKEFCCVLYPKVTWVITVT
jgi:hypothetical protein